MAQRVEVLLIDDIDGGDADQTITFAVDGVNYEIDLKDKNAEKFRKLLTQYTDKARKVGKGSKSKTTRTTEGPRGTSRTARNVSVKADTDTIRKWAQANGFAVADRGRIAANVVEAFEAAN